jgi:hypothetical protein
MSSMALFRIVDADIVVRQVEFDSDALAGLSTIAQRRNFRHCADTKDAIDLITQVHTLSYGQLFV